MSEAYQEERSKAFFISKCKPVDQQGIETDVQPVSIHHEAIKNVNSMFLFHIPLNIITSLVSIGRAAAQW